MKLIRTLVLPLALASCAKMDDAAFPETSNPVAISLAPSSEETNSPAAQGVGSDTDTGKAPSLSDAEIVSLAQLIVSYHDQASSILPATSKHAKRLTRLTKRHIAEDGMQFNFKAYQSADVDAETFADGSIRVSTGTMDLMRDEELLALLGHEIAHAKLGHNARQVGSAYAGRNGAGTVDAPEVATLAEITAKAPFSVSQEIEADSYGLQFLARHSYNPRGAVKALNKLANLTNESTGVGGWNVIHPAAKQRAERLASEIEQLKRDVPPGKMTHTTEPIDEDEIAEYEPAAATDVRVATLSRATDARKPAEPASMPNAKSQNTGAQNSGSGTLIDLEDEIKPAETKAARSVSNSQPRAQADPRDEEPLAPGWYVQVSAEPDNAVAVEILQKLHGIGFTGLLQRAIVNGTRYSRVLVGPFLNQAEASEARNQVKPHNLGTGNPFVKEIR